jgi:hypothetical protein
LHLQQDLSIDRSCLKIDNNFGGKGISAIGCGQMVAHCNPTNLILGGETP